MDSPISNQSSILARLRDKSRPVVVFGPGADDDRVARQRHSWVGPLPQAGIKDRDIVVIEAPSRGEGKAGGEPLSASESEELRALFSVPESDFLVVLIGRDGSTKERWTEPVSSQEIFGKIDGMPMRQEEVKSRGGGSE